MSLRPPVPEPEDDDRPTQDWLEALNRFLRQLGRVHVVGASVHKEPVPEGITGTRVGGWLIERRRNARGELALHLYQS